MKKIQTSIIFIFATITLLFSQVPEAFNYQAVVRNSSGEIIPNSNVVFRISILLGSETGPVNYVETHSVQSNNFGLVNLKIGMGTVVQGVFMPAGWGASTHYIKVEIDPNGGSAFTHLGTSLLLSVPYAFHAQTVAEDQVDDADADPNNEIQELQLSGTQLTLSKNGGTVTLPSSGGGDNWGTQTVASDATLAGEGTTANPLKVANNIIQPTWGNIQDMPGGFADNNDNVEDGDANPNNEIQTLSVSGNDLSISDGNTVTLPVGSSSLWQTSGNNIFFDSGNVGIGTNNPLDKLDVYGSAGFHRNGTGLLIGPSADMIQLTFKKIDGVYVSSRFYWGKTEFMGKFIVKDGTIGIGNDNPLFPVDIYNPIDAIINLKAGKNANIFLERGSSNDASVITFKNKGDAIEKYIMGLNRNDAFSLSTGNGQHGLFLYPNGDIQMTDNLLMQPNKKIGIGISDPAYSLEIMGNDIAGGLAIYNSTSGTGTISDGFLVSLETDNEAFLWNFENGPINIGTNNLNRVKITANGDVGIGTDNPTENLDVNGNIKIEDGYLLFTRQNYISSIYTSGNNIGISNAAQGAIEFSTNPTQGTQILQAIIDKDGNFGIGTSSPERILHIRGSNPRILIEATSSNPEINFKSAGDAATDIWAIYKNSSTGDLHFYQNGNKLTLQKNTGNVGIGTTTPQGKLDVNGAIYQRGGVLHADYVFEDNYQLETIEEHAEFMWKNKHLPAIPKATVDANGLEIVEVGSHRKGIVEELEKAHIYISQLEKKINEQSAIIQDLKTNADNKELLKRIETLEKLILSRKN